MRGSSARDESVDSFEEACHRHGLAVTVQRRTLFDELSTRRDHPTVDQLYETLAPRLPGLSRTTVYRVLEAFVEAGLVRRVHHDGSSVRFDPTVARHHHLLCDDCGRLVDVDDSVVPRIPLVGAKKAGLGVRDYTVNFTGTCADCLGAEKNR